MPDYKSILRHLRIEAHTAWLASRDPAVPRHARAFGFLIAAYALSPIDLIPDFIPVLGLLDEVVLIPIGIWLFLKLVPADIYARHRAAAEAASTRPVSRIGAVLIGVVWLIALGLVAALRLGGRF